MLSKEEQYIFQRVNDHPESNRVIKSEVASEPCCAKGSTLSSTFSFDEVNRKEQHLHESRPFLKIYAGDNTGDLAGYSVYLLIDNGTQCSILTGTKKIDILKPRAQKLRF